jgi:hypothetical protein
MPVASNLASTRSLSEQHTCDFLQALCVLCWCVLRQVKCTWSCPQVVRAKAKDPSVMPLVTARKARLEALTSKGPPEFSWAMPQAELPEYPEVHDVLPLQL